MAVRARRLMIHVRHAEPADAAQWSALRAALWPDEGTALHAAEVARFFAERSERPGSMPEVVFVATDPEGRTQSLIGFAEVSRRAARAGSKGGHEPGGLEHEHGCSTEEAAVVAARHADQ